MKQLIISIYDSWYYGEVYSNGKRNKPLETKIHKAYDNIPYKFWWDNDEKPTFKDYVLNEFGSLYESIIICEDGGIEVVK